MKKRMIPAGALFLVMACGQHATEHAPESKVALDLVTAADEERAEPPSAAEADGEWKSNGEGYNIYADANLGGGQPSTPASLGTLALTAVDPGKPRPDVGRAISSSAALQGTDTVRRFIRTADFRFRVKDVVNATLGIEDIVGAHDGWVTKTMLRSESRGQDHIPVSADSILEVSRYELINTITLRVPNTELDSTLRQIGRWVDLFDHRTILADDIRLRMMANAMAVRRAKAHSLRVAAAIDDQGRKLKETLSAEEALQASDERRDQGILNNIDLADRVAFSTVTLDIYQRTLVRKEMIANERSIEGYRPPLWTRICAALKDGWELVEIVITGLVSIWPVLLLLGGSLWLLWRKRGKPTRTAPARIVAPVPPADPPSQAAADN